MGNKKFTPSRNLLQEATIINTLANDYMNKLERLATTDKTWLDLARQDFNNFTNSLRKALFGDDNGQPAQNDKRL